MLQRAVDALIASVLLNLMEFYVTALWIGMALHGN